MCCYSERNLKYEEIMQHDVIVEGECGVVGHLNTVYELLAGGLRPFAPLPFIVLKATTLVQSQVRVLSWTSMAFLLVPLSLYGPSPIQLHFFPRNFIPDNPPLFCPPELCCDDGLSTENIDTWSLGDWCMLENA
ncbi:uncharacterized protein STEHIDRAFT_143761 [Stereum hirsutum FP-91666 SS1]|uniref:uncharacterized protein n=1 Tax=Stereum hirsutum (strain FP-91666) TaxID=721885 RepID=UPI000440A5CF|nr:uncharacterized protein STEHIDRAFT_143761 [Stereum hirsutum FP-91666 SS1]EIM92388.1 hypothetical protein STEHIDRAFT_143761 [Stereum hirsutum FP-91666 SS1]